MREFYVFESMEVELSVTKDYPSLIYLDGNFGATKALQIAKARTGLAISRNSHVSR